MQAGWPTHNVTTNCRIVLAQLRSVWKMGLLYKFPTWSEVTNNLYYCTNFACFLQWNMTCGIK